MFYSKNITAKRGSRKAFTVAFTGGVNTVTDDALLPLSVAKCNYNCGGKSGALKNEYGVDAFQLGNVAPIFPYAVIRAWYYYRSGEPSLLIAYCADKNLYQVDTVTPQTPALISNSAFVGVPTAVNYRLNDEDVMLFSSNSDEIRVYDGSSIYTVSGSPCVSSMCIHYERLFGCGGGNTLWFSDDLDPTNWSISSTEAGYIEMADDRGELQKVVSFADYVYVFRQYGIARVSAYSTQTEFSVTQLYVTSGKIYPETVAICGNKVLFMSEDGIFAFDGADTVKLLSNLDTIIIGADNSNACGSYVNGKYLLACNLLFGDNDKVLCEKGEYGNNAMLVLDLNDGSYTILRGMDVSYIQKIAHNETNTVLFCFGSGNTTQLGTLSQSGMCFADALQKSWLCPQTDLGQSYADKVLSYMVLYSRYDVEMVLFRDNDEYHFEIKGSPHAQKLPLNVKGRVFTLCFKTDYALMHVTQPKIVFKTYSEEV